MKAYVDRDTCIGCGLCEEICPEVFQLDDELISTIIAEMIPEESEECAKEAEDECPVSAITVE